MSDLTRAVIVVFSEKTTDTEAAMMRNGLHMFKGVQKLIPVRGVPDERQARTLLARDALVAEVEMLRQRCDELAARVTRTQEAITGPVPLTPDDEPIAAVFDRDNNLRRA
jgi:hypothetical protein